jgi:hypothetical protein
MFVSPLPTTLAKLARRIWDAAATTDTFYADKYVNLNADMVCSRLQPILTICKLVRGRKTWSYNLPKYTLLPFLFHILLEKYYMISVYISCVHLVYILQMFWQFPFWETDCNISVMKFCPNVLACNWLSYFMIITSNLARKLGLHLLSKIMPATDKY